MIVVATRMSVLPATTVALLHCQGSTSADGSTTTGTSCCSVRRGNVISREYDERNREIGMRAHLDRVSVPQRLAETIYAYDGAQQQFVNDFVAAWTKVMQLDRFDLDG